jgi:hypothetical protein
MNLTEGNNKPAPQVPIQQHMMAMASTTMQDHIQFYFKSTLLKAICNGHLATFPGLTVANVNKFLPKSMATSKGHLDQTRKNARSTQTAPGNECGPQTVNEPDGIAPNGFLAMPPITTGEKTQFVYAAIISAPNESGQIYTDQTGKFPITSRRGNKYFMVLYDYDSNAILAEPMKSRTGPEMTRAYEKLYNYLVARGLKPKLQKLDNEASQELQDFMQDKGVKFQFVPPHVHRRNAAERAIRTFKNHFIAGLCSTDKNFPHSLWDRIVEQAIITLNLLRTSRINPKLSAYAQLNGAFDFNATPMAPPGTRVLFHEKPNVRGSWAPHGEDGWYVGPAQQHYRCFTVHITSTNSERIGDTVDFFPIETNIPLQSSADAAMQAAKDLVHALQNPQPATPFDICNEQIQALKQLADVFDKAASKPLLGKAALRVGRENPPAETAAQKPFHHYNTRSNMRETAAATMTNPAVPTQDATINTIPLANSVIHPITGKSMEYRQLITDPETKAVWTRSAANEIGRLAQGVGNRMKGTNTIRFIPVTEVPQGRKATYGRFVCTVRPQKSEPERT